jgi:hypothetical protein
MLDGLRDFGEFLRSISRSVIGVMAGGIGLVLTMLGLWTSLPAKQLFIGGGVVAIVYAAFRVWQAERSARQREEAKQRDLSRVDKEVIAELKAKVAELSNRPVDPLLAGRRETFMRELAKLHPQGKAALHDIIIAGSGPMSDRNMGIASRTVLLEQDGNLMKICDGYKEVAAEWAGGKLPESV